MTKHIYIGNNVDDAELELDCKGCGKEAKLVKAHIIPESFFRYVNDGEPVKLITDAAGAFPKKLPIGVYDKNILCEGCEKTFLICDDYGYKVLIHEVDKHKNYNNMNGVLIGYEVNGVDHDLLHKFFVSILWRASVSEMPFYANVNLGPFENTAKEIAFGMRLPKKEEYAYILGRFLSNPASKVILDPRPTRVENINYVRVSLPEYTLLIKVDNRRPPQRMRDPGFDKNDPLYMPARSMENSGELSTMVSVVKQAYSTPMNQ